MSIAFQHHFAGAGFSLFASCESRSGYDTSKFGRLTSKLLLFQINLLSNKCDGIHHVLPFRVDLIIMKKNPLFERVCMSFLRTRTELYSPFFAPLVGR